MSKLEEDSKFLKIQTCILKVNIHCDGCKKKVKKLLHKVDGVYTTSVDSEQGKVTVSGNVDPAALIKKLAKAGKHAELLAPNGAVNNKSSNNQAVKTQPQTGKGLHKDIAKPINGGNGRGKDHKGQPLQPQPTLQQQLLLQQRLKQQLQQMKGSKDVQLPPLKQFNFPPQKDPKSVNFTPHSKRLDAFDEDDDEFDDDDDEYDDDEMDDEFDCFDADFDGDFKNIKIKPAISTPKGNGAKGGKGGGGNGGPAAGAKKGVQVPVQNKGANGKKGSSGSVVKNGGDFNKGIPNGNGGHHGQAQAGKSSNNPANGAKMVYGKNEVAGVVGGVGHPMVRPSMTGQVFPGRSTAPQTANIRAPMGQMGNIPPAAAAASMQRPLTGVPPPGYFQTGMTAPQQPPPPEVIAAAAANPFQQHYIAAMMHQQQLQQQHQRMMMMNAQERAAAFQPMVGYARPPVPFYNMPASPAMAAPMHHGDPYTTMFSDENATSSCSIM
ncbi:neurogenic protein mastermind-like [Canna indica]|uniref:Neurogenic protein mastermind-like n=1 Tax=Canna indica TaxID=4628 RepID=A0AAQ3JVV5_9LILI|nr:neurogenic protein mastermind-like [Canna indica]